MFEVNILVRSSDKSVIFEANIILLRYEVIFFADICHRKRLYTTDLSTLYNVAQSRLTNI